jgi:hypothetical protein
MGLSFPAKQAGQSNAYCSGGDYFCDMQKHGIGRFAEIAAGLLRLRSWKRQAGKGQQTNREGPQNACFAVNLESSSLWSS